MNDLIPIIKDIGPYGAAILLVGYGLYTIVRWMGARVVDLATWTAPRVDNMINKHLDALDKVTKNIDEHTVALQNISQNVAASRNEITVISDHQKEILQHVRPKATP